jgi:hypothetical protein
MQQSKAWSLRPLRNIISIILLLLAIACSNNNTTEPTDDYIDAKVHLNGVWKFLEKGYWGTPYFKVISNGQAVGLWSIDINTEPEYDYNDTTQYMNGIFTKNNFTWVRVTDEQSGGIYRKDSLFLSLTLDTRNILIFKTYEYFEKWINYNGADVMVDSGSYGMISMAFRIE